MKFTLKIPATSANIGPGFDSLGIALSMYNFVTFERIEKGFEILGCSEKYAGEDNLIYSSYRKTMEYMGISPIGVRITEETNIPISRGLGSSATMIAAGVMGANIMAGNPLSVREIFKICNEIEGHPDNIAPALFGGLTASAVDGDTPYTLRYEIDKSLIFCALIPDFETSTHEARAVLPKSVDFKDAVHNASHVAVLLKALEEGNEKLIKIALSDRLHEPYRAKLISGFEVVRALALSNGAISFFISGSGSTCMALTKDEGFADVMREKIKNFPNNWHVERLSVSENGVEVVDFED